MNGFKLIYGGIVVSPTPIDTASPNGLASTYHCLHATGATYVAKQEERRTKKEKMLKLTRAVCAIYCIVLNNPFFSTLFSFCLVVNTLSSHVFSCVRLLIPPFCSYTLSSSFYPFFKQLLPSHTLFLLLLLPFHSLPFLHPALHTPLLLLLQLLLLLLLLLLSLPSLLLLQLQLPLLQDQLDSCHTLPHQCLPMGTRQRNPIPFTRRLFSQQHVSLFIKDVPKLVQVGEGFAS